MGWEQARIVFRVMVSMEDLYTSPPDPLSNRRHQIMPLDDLIGEGEVFVK